MIRLIPVFAMCSLCAFAQTLTKPPTLIQQVQPHPPDGGVTAQGTVVMEVDLGPDGRVLAVKVVQGLTPELDAAAVAALERFVFSPAEIDNQPAAVRIQYALTFEAPLVVLDAGVPTVNLLGVLRTAGTREPIPGAAITVGEQSVVSIESGEFELFDVPAGEVTVIVTAPGFERFEAVETIRREERTEVVYFVKPTGVPTLETVVRTDKERREVTQVKLSRGELRSVAGTQGDAFKVLQSLPGVARAAFGSGALVVRGSKSWDSRVYVDEIAVPQLFHFAGLSATFNASMVDSISFQPGNWGASFGRSIGGLVQADVRSPSKTGLHGYIDLSTFDLSAMVELPVS